MSWRARVLGRKAGNEKALLISPGPTVRQLHRPVKRMSPGWPNLWQKDVVWRRLHVEPGEEAKEEISFHSACIVDCLFSGPSGLSTTRTDRARQGGKLAAELYWLTQLLACPMDTFHRAPLSWLTHALLKTISRATDPPYIWLSSLPFLPPGSEPLLFYWSKDNT